MIEIRPNEGWVESIMNDVQGGLDHFVGELAVEVRWRVAMRTPVLTGRARGNWNLSFNDPDYNFDWSYFDPTGELGDGNARAVAENAKAGDTIYITNGLPYIGPLDLGHSLKAAPGFIAVTAAEVPLIANMIMQNMGDQLHGRENTLGPQSDGP